VSTVAGEERARATATMSAPTTGKPMTRYHGGDDAPR
jgi:hypothetical protein